SFSRVFGFSRFFGLCAPRRRTKTRSQGPARPWLWRPGPELSRKRAICAVAGRNEPAGSPSLTNVDAENSGKAQSIPSRRDPACRLQYASIYVSNMSSRIRDEYIVDFIWGLG